MCEIDIAFIYLTIFAGRNLRNVVKQVCSKLNTRPGWLGAPLRTQSQHVHVPEVHVHVPEVHVHEGFGLYSVGKISDSGSAVPHFCTTSAPHSIMDPLFSLR